MHRTDREVRRVNHMPYLWGDEREKSKTNRLGKRRL